MAQLTVITTPDLAPGFRLTGARVLAAEDSRDAERLLRQELKEERSGIIALIEPFYHALPGDLLHRIQTEYEPLVVPLPDGLPGHGQVARRQRLTEMMRRVIGFSISFRGQEEK
jgi:vacuolar-type H+-ATPase subunit F/Vma7